jgi:hypothetical protein
MRPEPSVNHKSLQNRCGGVVEGGGVEDTPALPSVPRYVAAADPANTLGSASLIEW